MNRKMAIALVILALILGLSDWAGALNHSGYIDLDETWALADSPHIIEGLIVVRSSATLTIEPGVVVKIDPNATNPRLIIGSSTSSGRLIAVGTDTQKIVFTSNSANPQPGDWANIYFWPNAADDSIIENAVIEFGGSPGQGSIYINESNPTIRNCTIRYSAGPGIEVRNSSAEISCSDIQNNQVGVYATSSTPIISENNISGNLDWGIFNATSSAVLDAANNWWGDASGPGGAGPGSGDAVSQYVNYTPWLTEVSYCENQWPVGDCNEDGAVTSADVTCTIIEIFNPAGNESADCNGDGAVTSADVTCTILCTFGMCP